MKENLDNSELQRNMNESESSSEELDEVTGKYFESDSETESISDIRESIAEEDIRKRAYEIFLERGGLPGHPQADWYKAEQELIRKAYKDRRSM